jgi:hypothetical protein
VHSSRECVQTDIGGLAHDTIAIVAQGSSAGMREPEQILCRDRLGPRGVYFDCLPVHRISGGVSHEVDSSPRCPSSRLSASTFIFDGTRGPVISRGAQCHFEKGSKFKLKAHSTVHFVLFKRYPFTKLTRFDIAPEENGEHGCMRPTARHSV